MSKVVSPPLCQVRSDPYIVEDDLKLIENLVGGSWLGALGSGFLSDRLGRKTAIQIGAVIWCVSSVIPPLCADFSR